MVGYCKRASACERRRVWAKPLTRDQVRVLKHLLEAGIDGQMKAEIGLHQQKTKQETHVALSPYTQGKLRQWITESGKSLHDFLFTGIRKSKSENQIIESICY